MKLLMKLITVIICFFSFYCSYSQGGIGKEYDSSYQTYYDSLKAMDYPYPLPLLGKKAYKRGYDLSPAWGISGVYFTQTQEIIIQSTQIGINGGKKVDFSDFINFGPTIAVTNAYTVRPDVWVLPFLNVYGILGVGTTETNVTLIKPIGFETSQHFSAQSYGLGVTLAGSVGPLWLAWDNNYNFVDVDVLVEPMPAFNSSFRLGHTIRYPKKPQRALAIWAGVFYQKINNDTKGSIPLNSVFPEIGNGAGIDYMREWANGLPPAQKIIANQIIDKIEEKANGSDISNTQIDYELDKKVASPFNIILGAQYQINKKWIIRSELGVFGKRSQFMLNLNYRFYGFKKRH